MSYSGPHFTNEAINSREDKKPLRTHISEVRSQGSNSDLFIKSHTFHYIPPLPDMSLSRAGGG